jgi:hypothetical protein
VYDSRIKAGESPAAVAASIFNTTGLVPPKFGVALRGAIASNDAASFGAGLTTASSMLRSNPNAFAGVDGGEGIEKQAVRFKHLTEDMGMSSEQATKRLMDEASQPALDPVKQEALQQFRKTSLTQDTIDARLKSKFSAELPSGNQRTAMSSIYSEFAEEGYEKFRDPGQALAFADFRVEQQFGVQNGVLMRYPPAKSGLSALPGASDSHAWATEQATKTVLSELGIVVDASQVLLVPVERNGVSTSAAFKGKPMTVNRKDAGDPNQQTSFTSVPYQIMVMPKTPDQDLLTVPGVFFPDLDTYVNDHNAAVAAEPQKPLIGRFGTYAPPKVMFTTPEGEQRAKNHELRANHEKNAARQKNFNTDIDGQIVAKQKAVEKLKRDVARMREEDPGEVYYVEQQIQALESQMYELRRTKQDFGGM